MAESGEWQQDERFSSSAASTDDFVSGLSETASGDTFTSMQQDIAADAQRAAPEQTADIPSLDPAEVERQIEEARASAYSEGYIQGKKDANEEVEERLKREQKELAQTLEEFLTALRKDLESQVHLYAPLTDLSLALAEQIAGIEFEHSREAVAALVQRLLDEVDPTELTKTKIFLPKTWATKLEAEPFTGLLADFEIIADPQLEVGSARISVNERVIEDLMDERVVQLAKQLLTPTVGKDAPLPKPVQQDEAKTEANQIPQVQPALSADVIPDSDSPAEVQAVPESIPTDASVDAAESLSEASKADLPPTSADVDSDAGMAVAGQADTSEPASSEFESADDSQWHQPESLGVKEDTDVVYADYRDVEDD
ncbi:MAG TPA: hypothetical protein DER02_11850 [Gammaproteobacteria bacterium]|nr:hypothetical protein [Gammaproteobacteria bacterium]